MNIPILLMCGPAGSGKDTCAGIIARKYNGVCIAMADPMKRLAKAAFAFTDEQLWGPSESRNAPDERYKDIEMWKDALARLTAHGPNWLKGLGLDPRDTFQSLYDWFYQSLIETHIQFVPTNWNPWWHHGRIEKLLTPRYVLQTVGSEWGRNFSKNIWVDHAMKTARALLAGGPRYDRTIGLSDDVGYHGPDFVIITDGRFRNEVVTVNEANGTTVKVVPGSSSGAEAGEVAKAGVSGHVSEKELTGIPDHFYQYLLHNDKSRGLEKLETAINMLMFSIRSKTTQIWVNAIGSVNTSPVV